VEKGGGRCADEEKHKGPAAGENMKIQWGGQEKRSKRGKGYRGKSCASERGKGAKKIGGRKARGRTSPSSGKGEKPSKDEIVR